VRLRYMPSTADLPAELAAVVNTAGPAAVVSLRLPRPLLAGLDREAHRLRCSRSSLVRGLLALGLDQLQEQG
jgi:hypothetical protein